MAGNSPRRPLQSPSHQPLLSSNFKIERERKKLWNFHLYLIRRSIKNPLFWQITKVISQSLDRLPTTNLIFISFKIKTNTKFSFFWTKCCCAYEMNQIWYFNPKFSMYFSWKTCQIVMAKLPTESGKNDFFLIISTSDYIPFF